MRIGIVGAGAIGGLIGVRLACLGHEVCALARGATLEALRAGSWALQIEGERLEARAVASDNAAMLGAQDILIVAIKGPSLAAAARAMTPMIGTQTIVIPAMNGVPWWFLLAGGGSLRPTALESVDPDSVIAHAIPFEQVLGCVVHASAYVSAPATVMHHSGNKLIFGEPRGGSSDRLQAVARLFEEAGFAAIESKRIQRDIWYKLWGNMTMNPISAIAGVTCDRILDDELVRAFVLSVMAEAREIGERIDCEIPESGEDRIALTRQIGAFKTSMLQDAEAGRPLEIDQLLTAPREIAQLTGIPTPHLDTLLGLARLYARSHGLY